MMCWGSNSLSGLLLTLFINSLLMSFGPLFGKSGCEYRVDMYLQVKRKQCNVVKSVNVYLKTPHYSPQGLCMRNCTCKEVKSNKALHKHEERRLKYARDFCTMTASYQQRRTGKFAREGRRQHRESNDKRNSSNNKKKETKCLSKKKRSQKKMVFYKKGKKQEKRK